ncbi:MAG: hypothetical protein IJF83_03515 [Methanobrevibacter sp.]|nr:hypothetical protein [Methanobrevibacter sp.]
MNPLEAILNHGDKFIIGYEPVISAFQHPNKTASEDRNRLFKTQHPKHKFRLLNRD